MRPDQEKLANVVLAAAFLANLGQTGALPKGPKQSVRFSLPTDVIPKDFDPQDYEIEVEMLGVKQDEFRVTFNRRQGVVVAHSDWKKAFPAESKLSLLG